MAEVKGKTPKAAKPGTEQVAAAPVLPAESPVATSAPAGPAGPVAPVDPALGAAPLEASAVTEPLTSQVFSVPAALVAPLELEKDHPELWSFYARTCQAAVDVLKERCRQVEGEGYSTEQDDAYTDYQLPRAAICYGIKAGGLPDHRATLYWPFNPSAFKPTDRRGSLVKAAALLLAEIERLDRAENPID